MTAKKNTDELTRRYRVARQFRHGGRLISRSTDLADLPQAEVKRRVERGYIEDRAPAASDTAPAAKAKE